jgi:predicted dehydrogenase
MNEHIKPIKCGVIGAGWWATYAHIPALLTHPAAELIAVQKRDFARARKVADDFGVPVACTTVSELLAIEGLQAVVVSSSPNLHFDHAREALNRGKHLLIEKPMTMTAAEARQLVDLAHEQNLQFLISCPWHYTSHAAEARRLVRGGHLGKMRMISVLMTNPVSHLLRGTSSEVTHGTPYMRPMAGTYSDPKIAGGGQIYTQVSHVAAYLAFLTGARPSEVFARFHNDGEAVDIYDVINLEMSDSSLVSIASTGATSLNRRDFEIRLYGTDGMLFLDLWGGHMEFVPMSGTPTRYADLPATEIYPERAPAWNLIDSILDPTRNISPATLGQIAMEVIEGACQSASTGENISIHSGTCEKV